MMISCPNQLVWTSLSPVLSPFVAAAVALPVVDSSGTGLLLGFVLLPLSAMPPLIGTSTARMILDKAKWEVSPTNQSCPVKFKLEQLSLNLSLEVPGCPFNDGHAL